MQTPLPNWQVNARTNKQWRLRVRLVSELSDWVYQNHDPDAPVFGPPVPFTRQKAGQYVIDHLALGKMVHPSEAVDPLFTSQDYEDESLQDQLYPGRYREFRGLVRAKIDEVLAFDTAHAPEVTWEWVAEFLQAKRCNARRLWELQCGLIGHAPRHPPLGRASPAVTLKMTALVLRYMCMGAFESNFHASILPGFAHRLPGFVECFASPFNHKLRDYYSMFDQDRDFGSRGNFFAFLKHHSDTLPPGNYEMNPPFTNAIFERLQAVIARTLAAQRTVTILLIGPNWGDTNWVPSLDRTLVHAPAMYQTFSGQYVQNIPYVQDLTGAQFPQKTLAWVFSSRPPPPALLELLNTGAR
jgi:hypothetical protein